MPSGSRDYYPYPSPSVRVLPFAAFLAEYRRPPGFDNRWPPGQVLYINDFAKQSGCQTVIVEDHYIDRDFVDDVSLFYSRSLRPYPNHCRRYHFFQSQFDEKEWRRLFSLERDSPNSDATRELKKGYLGFTVMRPLPAYPVGRTVLAPIQTGLETGWTLCTRRYQVHLCGFTLVVHGLAFQQQDQGVSACATTALWSSLHKMAAIESLQIPTPAFLTQSACRHHLSTGRALPQEGLSIDQICEGCRAAGLAAIVLRSGGLKQLKRHLHAILQSGFPPLLALRARNGDGHAVCAVGFGEAEFKPTSGTSVHDAGDLLTRLVIHDDRLGPYAHAILSERKVRTKDGKSSSVALLTILNARGKQFDEAEVIAIVAPLPSKLRLGVPRLRKLGFDIGKSLVQGVHRPWRGNIVVRCSFEKAVEYIATVASGSMDDSVAYSLAAETPVSRYIGKIAISDKDGDLFHIILDATETEVNPSVLAFVACRPVPETSAKHLMYLAKLFGVDLLVSKGAKRQLTS